MIGLGFYAWKEEIKRYYNRIFDHYVAHPKWMKIWDFIWIAFIFIIAGPIYTISRLITFLYPFLCIMVALYGKNDFEWFSFNFNKFNESNDNNIFNYILKNIPFFPGIVTLIYLILLLIVLILSIYVYKLIQLCFLIYPSEIRYCDIGSFDGCSKYLNKIMHYYNWHQNKSLINACIIDSITKQVNTHQANDYSVLGMDIAKIIITFLPKHYKDELIESNILDLH